MRKLQSSYLLVSGTALLLFALYHISYFKIRNNYSTDIVFKEVMAFSCSTLIKLITYPYLLWEREGINHLVNTTNPAFQGTDSLRRHKAHDSNNKALETEYTV